MAQKPVPDAKILQYANRRLSSCGIRPPAKVTVTSQNGDVTLSGTLQYEHQRLSATQALNGVEGVRRIIDRLTVAPPHKRV